VTALPEPPPLVEDKATYKRALLRVGTALERSRDQGLYVNRRTLRIVVGENVWRCLIANCHGYVEGQVLRVFGVEVVEPNHVAKDIAVDRITLRWEYDA
jgi:hypothetical protein